MKKKNEDPLDNPFFEPDLREISGNDFNAAMGRAYQKHFRDRLACGDRVVLNPFIDSQYFGTDLDPLVLHYWDLEMGPSPLANFKSRLENFWDAAEKYLSSPINHPAGRAFVTEADIRKYDQFEMTSKLNDAQKHAFRVLRYIRIIQEEFLFPDKPVYAEGPIQFDPIAWGNKRRLLPKPRKSRKLTVDYLELEKHCREGSGNFRSSHYEPHPRRHDDWPRTRLRDPDPFTEDERDKILAYFKQKIPHYYPFVLTQFSTGMRPSEALALRWSDIDLERREIYISKSRYIDDGAATKTAGSVRVIKLVQHVGKQLQQLFNSTPRRLDDDGQEHVFLNEDGKPIDFHTWRGKVSGRETQAGEKTPHGVWYRALRGAGVRPRGPYHTRHVHLSRA